MKVYMNNPNENWATDKIRADWYRQKPDISTENPEEADIIWIAAPWQWMALGEQLLSSKKVLCTIHHIVPNKFTNGAQAEFIARDRFVDAYHVPNKYTAQFVSRFTNKPIHTLGYWFDSTLWQPIDKSIARTSVGIDESRYVIGSFQRDTEGSDLISPKLEKGPDVFCDTVERIIEENRSAVEFSATNPPPKPKGWPGPCITEPDPIPVKDVLVLLGGWRRQYVINRLETAGIEYKYIEMAPTEKLKEMYACCDLYIVSSRVEGGPQALLEAPAMKVPIISTRMGSAEFLLHPNCIFYDGQEKIHFPEPREVEECYNIVQEYDIVKHADKYEELLRSLI